MTASDLQEALKPIHDKLGMIETQMENLSNDVQELGVYMGPMNDRLKETEKAVNGIATALGTHGVPVVGGGGHAPTPVKG